MPRWLDLPPHDIYYSERHYALLPSWRFIEEPSKRHERKAKKSHDTIYLSGFTNTYCFSRNNYQGRSLGGRWLLLRATSVLPRNVCLDCFDAIVLAQTCKSIDSDDVNMSVQEGTLIRGSRPMRNKCQRASAMQSTESNAGLSL